MRAGYAGMLRTSWTLHNMCMCAIDFLGSAPSWWIKRTVTYEQLSTFLLHSFLILQQIKTRHLSLAPAYLLGSDSQLAPKYSYFVVLMSHQIHYSVASSFKAAPSFPVRNLGSHPTVVLPFPSASAHLVCYKELDTGPPALTLSTSHPGLAVNLSL